MYSEIRGLYALPNTLLQVMYDSPSSSKRRSPLLGRWVVTSCTQRTLRQVRCLLSVINPFRFQSNPFFLLRPTTRTVVHPEVNVGHVFFLSGCTPGPTAERCVERAARMASPGGVDHGARTERHGCRERSPASSGTFFRVQCPDGVDCVGGLFFEGFVLRHARASSS